MIKINISREMIQEHKNYYRNNALPRIEQELSKQINNKSEIESIYTESAEEVAAGDAEFNPEDKKKETEYSLSKKVEKRIKLLEYCKEHWEELAVGEPSKLRDIINDMKNEGVNEYLKSDKEYAKELHEKVFGYEIFTGIKLNFIDLIFDYAKYKTKQEKFNSTVTKELMNSIKEYFPHVYTQAEEKIKPLIEKNSKIRRTELVEELKKLDFPAITLDNYIQHNSWNNLWNPYKFIYMIGLRTCPYCNRQYITPLYRDNGGKMRADLDHFFAKSLYPYLSMSLYNLVPSCRFCNSSLKGAKEFDVNDINPYEDSLDKYMVFDTQLLSDGRGTELSLKERDNIPLNAKNTISNYKKIFELEATYQYHKNIANNIEQKIRHYNNEKVKVMRDKLKGIIDSENEIKELVVGKLPKEEEILDEPLNKLKKDILEKYKYFK